jgi:hypothetical protein
MDTLNGCSTGPGATATDRDVHWAGATVHTYTRAQAIADGVLVEVAPALAAEAGFRCPVALTAGAWADAVAWDEHTEAGKPAATGQDEAGRLWDVLTMARWAISRRGGGPAERLAFQVLRVPATGRGLRPRPTTLHLLAGPGDDAELVLTVPLPGED